MTSSFRSLELKSAGSLDGKSPTLSSSYSFTPAGTSGLHLMVQEIVKLWVNKEMLLNSTHSPVGKEKD